ncbi:MAG: YncE family protein [Gemmatimonadaceae bacterium]
MRAFFTAPVARAAIISMALGAPAAAQSNAYSVTHTYSLGGAGGWDYVVPDASNHRLYIGRSDRVMVVDSRDGKLVGEVNGIHGAHGTAIVAAAHLGFATSGNDSSVVAFDLTTFKPVAKIHAAEDADAIIYDAASNRVFTFNGDAHSSTVIDPSTVKLIANIDLGGKPEYGLSAGDGKVYANLTDKAEVVEIDAKTLKVTRRWSTASCKNPVAMAIDVSHQRLFSGCRSGVMAVSDYRAGKVVATVPIGQGVDGAGYDSQSSDAFASAADGSLTVIHQDGPDKYHVVQTLTTMTGSRNLGLDPGSHTLFLPGAKFEPPPTGARAGQRAKMLDGSFVLLAVERK